MKTYAIHCKCYVLFIGILCSFSLYGQSTLRGTVSVQSSKGGKVPLPYASIALYNNLDTTVCFQGTISDGQGNYLFEKIRQGEYLLKVSYRGMKTEKDALHITGQPVPRRKNFLFTEESNLLGEVVIEQNCPIRKRTKGWNCSP